MQVVLGANVLVSAALPPDGVCGRLLLRLAESALEVVVRPVVIEEVERVLVDPRAGCDPLTRSEFVEYVRASPGTRRIHQHPAPRSVDAYPTDDYLARLALAAERRMLVAADRT